MIRLAALALLSLTACMAPDAPAKVPAPAGEPSASADTTRSRADAAGLTEAQASELERLGVPVYVPVLPPGWTLAEATSAAPTSDGDVAYPEYTLRYRTPAGACLSIVAASEGLGDIFLDTTPNGRDVAVRGVPTSATYPVRLGWSAPGDGTEGWDGGRVQTEWFGTDGLALNVGSDGGGGCAMASPDDAEALLASLRPLDPADDALLLGPTLTADVGALPNGPDPEALALAAYGPEEPGEGRQATAVETLRRRDAFAVVLVTTADQADDSVRDERTRVVLMRRGAEWEIVSAGTQTRCQPGRGHAEWSGAVCM